MSTTFESDLEFLIKRKERANNGQYNCLPLPFPTARKKFPGFERGSYVIVTANQKVGKSKFTDYLFVYKSIEYVMTRKAIKPHILYFSLEENPRAKRIGFYEYLFYKLDEILVDNKILTSTDNEYPCEQWVLDKLKSPEYKAYIDAYMDMVEFSADSRTGMSESSADGIYSICLRYAEKNGHYNKLKKKVYNSTYKTEIEEEYINENDPFSWNDDEVMPIVIIDNFANLKVPKGSTLYHEIEVMSKYCIILKNLGFLVVGVQHQAQEKESLTRRQNNDVVPSAEGLSDNKSTSKDLTLLVGLMSPFKYEMRDFMGYDITKWRDNIRFLFIKEDRNNGAINLCQPLLFIGESSVFAELPPYTDTKSLDEVYTALQKKKAEYEQNFQKKKILATIFGRKKKEKFHTFAIIIQ